MKKTILVNGLFGLCLVFGAANYAFSEDGELKLNSADGSTKLVIQDKSAKTVTGFDSVGNIVTLGTVTVAGSGFSVGGSTFVVKDGSVGIGTTSPGAALDVNGAIRTAAGQNFKVRYSTVSVSVSLPQQYGTSFGTVNFGYTFSSVPVVMITGTSMGSYVDAINPTALNITTTGFTLYLFNSATGSASGTYTCNWIAIGD